MKIDRKASESVHVNELTTVKLRALWALDALTGDSKTRFTASEIANFLTEDCHISTPRQSVTSAFAKEKTLINKNSSGYKLMQAGRKIIHSDSSSGVHVIKAGEPFFSKNVILKEIFAGFVGTLQIVDPYLDVNTLDLLFNNLNKSMPTRILTQNIASRPNGTFERQLSDLRLDGFQIEVGKYTNSKLHDRYIIDDEVIWHSGNSLNSLGRKESILSLLSEDTREIMLAKFNERWKIAITL